jgi:hypothetical protein
MGFVGLIIVYFMGQVIPMVEPFETRKACEEALVEGVKSVEVNGKGQAKVLIAECRKVG